MKFIPDFIWKKQLWSQKRLNNKKNKEMGSVFPFVGMGSCLLSPQVFCPISYNNRDTVTIDIHNPFLPKDKLRNSLDCVHLHMWSCVCVWLIAPFDLDGVSVALPVTHGRQDVTSNLFTFLIFSHVLWAKTCHGSTYYKHALQQQGCPAGEDTQQPSVMDGVIKLWLRLFFAVSRSKEEWRGQCMWIVKLRWPCIERERRVVAEWW